MEDFDRKKPKGKEGCQAKVAIPSNEDKDEATVIITIIKSKVKRNYKSK
jgi:hypothetical protein